MENKEISEKRRKLILASAATPLAATLKSGAAMAASSAVCQPIYYDVSNMKTVIHGNSLEGDSAVRYELPYRVRKSGSQSSGGSAKIYEVRQGVWFHNDGVPFNGDLDDYELQNDKAYVLALYGTDEDGTYFVGLWPEKVVSYEGNGQFPINTSCLTSISPGGNFNYTGM